MSVLTESLADRERWIAHALHVNSVTTPGLLGIAAYPQYEKALKGGSRKEGRFYFDPRVSTQKSGPYPGIDGAPDLSLHKYPGSAKQFRSYSDIKNDKSTMHVRPKKGPVDLFIQPNTASQYIGWKVLDSSLSVYVKDIYDPVTNYTGLYKPKMGSRETKYAESLILGPRAI
ncbi:hypothetical protein GUITHDRAFT_122590 [Guillardia theta CCMP2712]|uniref:Uncharacterized protein n=1 Tax=Guillardia theta (strain CCMP2712) TaxID=905079 RepID=L1I4M6_GUITC|nr:hypothetical protein GUITHDRAFT_122590 [Guillardia theta CCMP2712]EKX31201.1 hypothetical protein GUITHDRAFT_122590 [Guillardia theta CCMP2712]|eukprot:XP_005818181.1 hypothetical protein GUITHDRAFT_122590 [Guillardia theta CCMP2712]